MTYFSENTVMESMIKIRKVEDLGRILNRFPHDWKLEVSGRVFGNIIAEHRQTESGEDIIVIRDETGGRIGENPLTEAEYEKESRAFLSDLQHGYRYTSIHGDHRTYHPGLGDQATCYGKHYDRRIIERMVLEGLIPSTSVDLERVGRLGRLHNP